MIHWRVADTLRSVSEQEQPPAEPRSTELRITVPRELMVRQPARTGPGRASMIFAAVGVVIAVLAGAVYAFRETAAPPPLTPEQTVNEFLSAVFLAADPQRTDNVVCNSWSGADAVTRTVKEMPADAHVSWDELSIVSQSETKVTLRARLGLRLRDDIRPTTYEQWRFNLVKEDGWRVCEARPFTV